MTGGATRCLDDDGYAAGRRMPEELGERFSADAAGADGRVPVSSRAQWILAVVRVDQAEPAPTDCFHQRIEGRAHASRFGDVMAGGVRVAGVEADPKSRVVVERSEQRRQVLHGRGERLSTAGS